MRTYGDLEQELETATKEWDLARLVAERAIGDRRELEAENTRLRAAAQDFVDKVESGQAQSRSSYAKFKAALGQNGVCKPSAVDSLGSKDGATERRLDRCAIGNGAGPHR